MRPRLHSTRSSDSRSRELTGDLHSATASTWALTSWPVCWCRGRLRFPDTGHDLKEVNVGKEPSHGPVRCLRLRQGFDGDNYHEPQRVPTACWRSVTFCHSRHHPPLDTPLVTHACAKEQAAGQHYFDNSKGARILWLASIPHCVSGNQPVVVARHLPKIGRRS